MQVFSLDCDKYINMRDEEVVCFAKSGNSYAQEFLLNKYKNFVRAKAKPYFLIGADKEDIIQEGMIGLYKAIIDFKPDKLVSFKVFAELCINRQMITAIKTATRQKHMPLNSYISLNKPMYEEGSERTLEDIVTSLKVSDPEELIVIKEELNYINKAIDEVLSDLETKVLQSYLDGKSYVEIAEELDKQPKSIDNALQRVKRKMEKHLR